MDKRIPLKYIRKWQIIKYGWKDAGEISRMPDVKISRWKLFCDIINCFKKYYLFSNIYKDNQVWALDEEGRRHLAASIGEGYRKRDAYSAYYIDNWKFLNKYTSLKYSKNYYLIAKRNNAYAKQYGWDASVYVQYGVTLICEHCSIGKINVGKKVLLARNVDIDFTGDITIGNGVALTEGVKILTHDHDIFGLYDDDELIPFSNRAHLTPLIIEDNVFVGAHAIIMPNVKKIGENSIISSGSVVTKEVPPNVIVSGNPAKVVRQLYPGSRVHFEYKKDEEG